MPSVFVQGGDRLGVRQKVGPYQITVWGYWPSGRKAQTQLPMDNVHTSPLSTRLWALIDTERRGGRTLEIPTERDAAQPGKGGKHRHSLQRGWALLGHMMLSERHQTQRATVCDSMYVTCLEQAHL